jgi:hypothetical protein
MVRRAADTGALHALDRVNACRRHSTDRIPARGSAFGLEGRLRCEADSGTDANEDANDSFEEVRPGLEEMPRCQHRADISATALQ